MQDFVCALEESVSPVLCKFCNQISIHTSNLFICASVVVFFFLSQFWLILLSLLWISFQVDCLFPCPLFCLVGFYCVPSSAACFSVFSFCLIYYGWDLFSKDCKVVAPLTYRICPQGWGWPTVLWWFPGLEVVVSAFWWVELDVVSIKGSVVSTGVLWAICELWMTLGSVVFLFW